MKMKWEEPRIEVQKFMPNEYVAACVVGSIQCVYPGANNFKMGDNGIYDDYTGGLYGGVYTDGEGKTHGICGYETPVSFNGSTAQGYESNAAGVAQHNRPIYNIQGYSLEAGIYYVTWTSNDQGIMGSEASNVAYHHKGRLTIKYIDNDHPNRS